MRRARCKWSAFPHKPRALRNLFGNPRKLTKMAKKVPAIKDAQQAQPDAMLSVVQTLPLWQLDIGELTGHNLESRGREDVNALLQAGWLLLHVYTLKYHEDGIWRERPMAILGKPRSLQDKPAL